MKRLVATPFALFFLLAQSALAQPGPVGRKEVRRRPS